MLRNELVSVSDNLIEIMDECSLVIDNKGRFIHLSKKIQKLFSIEDQVISGIFDIKTINSIQVLQFFRKLKLNVVKQKTIFIQLNGMNWKLKICFYAQTYRNQKITFISIKDYELLTNQFIYFDRKIKSLERKVFLQQQIMNEMNHRIKNNIAIAASLLRNKSDECLDDNNKTILRNSVQQLLTIADFHSFISIHSFYRGIEMKAYLSKIIAHIKICYALADEQLQFQLSCDSIKLKNEKALIIGLIINELISNTYKYAFPYVSSGKILISLTKTKEQFLLVYQDNGKQQMDDELVAGNGLLLVKGLCNQLGGNLKTNFKKGFYFQLKFT